MQGKGEGWVSHCCPTSFPRKWSRSGNHPYRFPPCLLLGNSINTTCCCLSKTNCALQEDRKAIPKVVTPVLGCPMDIVLQHHSVCKVDLQQTGFTMKMVCPQATLLPTTQPSIESKAKEKRLLEMQQHLSWCWGSCPCQGSKHWDCQFPWLWVELPADPGSHLQMNHGFLWKKACPGETRQPTA